MPGSDELMSALLSSPSEQGAGASPAPAGCQPERAPGTGHPAPRARPHSCAPGQRARTGTGFCSRVKKQEEEEEEEEEACKEDEARTEHQECGQGLEKREGAERTGRLRTARPRFPVTQRDGPRIGSSRIHSLLDFLFLYIMGKPRIYKQRWPPSLSPPWGPSPWLCSSQPLGVSC